MLTEVLKVIGTATWAALLAESIVAVACLTSILSRPIARLLSDEQRRIVCWLRKMKLKPADRADHHRRLHEWSQRIPEATIVAKAAATSELSTVQIEIGIALQKVCGSIQSVLRFVIPTAPFLGLLGTVQGVVLTLATFASNPGDPKAMFSGISFALMTTLCGMLIALTAMFARSQVERQLWHRGEELLELVLAIRATTPPLRKKKTALVAVTQAPAEPLGKIHRLANRGRWLLSRTQRAVRNDSRKHRSGTSHTKRK